MGVTPTSVVSHLADKATSLFLQMFIFPLLNNWRLASKALAVFDMFVDTIASRYVPMYQHISQKSKVGV